MKKSYTSEGLVHKEYHNNLNWPRCSPPMVGSVLPSNIFPVRGYWVPGASPAGYHSRTVSSADLQYRPQPPIPYHCISVTPIEYQWTFMQPIEYHYRPLPVCPPSIHGPPWYPSSLQTYNQNFWGPHFNDPSISQHVSLETNRRCNRLSIIEPDREGSKPKAIESDNKYTDSLSFEPYIKNSAQTSLEKDVKSIVNSSLEPDIKSGAHSYLEPVIKISGNSYFENETSTLSDTENSEDISMTEFNDVKQLNQNNAKDSSKKACPKPFIKLNNKRKIKNQNYIQKESEKEINKKERNKTKERQLCQTESFRNRYKTTPRKKSDNIIKKQNTFKKPKMCKESTGIMKNSYQENDLHYAESCSKVVGLNNEEKIETTLLKYVETSSMALNSKNTSKISSTYHLGKSFSEEASAITEPTKLKEICTNQMSSSNSTDDEKSANNQPNSSLSSVEKPSIVKDSPSPKIESGFNSAEKFIPVQVKRFLKCDLRPKKSFLEKKSSNSTESSCYGSSRTKDCTPSNTSGSALDGSVLSGDPHLTPQSKIPISESCSSESNNSSLYITPVSTPTNTPQKHRFKRSLSDQYQDVSQSTPHPDLNSTVYYTPENSPSEYSSAKRFKTRWSDFSFNSDSNLSHTSIGSPDKGGIQPELIGYQMVGDSQFCRFGQQLLGLQRVSMPNCPGRIGICVSGQTITDLHKRVKEKFYPISEKIILMIGTNDFLRSVEVTTMCKELTALIKTLQETASNIVLLTLPPIPKLERKHNFNHFKLLEVYNSHIRSLENGEKLRIADISPLYMSSPPYQRCRMHLFEKFFAGPARRCDLIHLNRDGLEVIRKYILDKFL